MDDSKWSFGDVFMVYVGQVRALLLLLWWFSWTKFILSTIRYPKFWFFNKIIIFSKINFLLLSYSYQFAINYIYCPIWKTFYYWLVLEYLIIMIIILCCIWSTLYLFHYCNIFIAEPFIIFVYIFYIIYLLIFNYYNIIKKFYFGIYFIFLF